MLRSAKHNLGCNVHKHIEFNMNLVKCLSDTSGATLKPDTKNVNVTIMFLPDTVCSLMLWTKKSLKELQL
jgi:hypothetical protein